MKLSIIGSRSFTDYAALEQAADKIHATEIISGGATGADTLAAKYAKNHNIKMSIFLPKFKTDKTIQYHPKYYLERNKQIVDESDYVLAFWDGKSKGTKYTINYAKKQKKDLAIIHC